MANKRNFEKLTRSVQEYINEETKKTSPLIHEHDEYIKREEIVKVAKTGSYNDLFDTPEIPDISNLVSNESLSNMLSEEFVDNEKIKQDMNSIFGNLNVNNINSSSKKVSDEQVLTITKYIKTYVDRNSNQNVIFYAEYLSDMYNLPLNIEVKPGAKCFVAEESKYYSYYNNEWYDDKCYIVSDEPPENTDLIWIDTSGDLRDYNSTVSMDSIYQTIQILFQEILDLKARVKYLEEHGGGGTATIVRDSFLLENGEKLYLEDGTELLLESDTGGTIVNGGDNTPSDSFLMENGEKLLLENGDPLLLETA